MILSSAEPDFVEDPIVLAMAARAVAPRWRLRVGADGVAEFALVLDSAMRLPVHGQIL